MQILYWHLTRPLTSTCSGCLSPPLLQRRDEIVSANCLNFCLKVNQFPSSLFSPGTIEKDIILQSSSPEGGDTGFPNQSHPEAMEIENDDQTPTFYLLNAVDLPENDDTALNNHLELLQHGHTSTYNGPLVAIGNGPSGSGVAGGGGVDPSGRGHYSNQPHKVVVGGINTKKRKSNDLARILSMEDEESDEDSSLNIGPSKSKKAKLVVNLYPEDQGYSVGYHVPGSNEFSESHTIPYSERYLLDSIDQEQIPHKVLCKLEDKEGVCLMRYRNQVIAEIRDYRKSLFGGTGSTTIPLRNSSGQVNTGVGVVVNNNNSALLLNGNLGWNGKASNNFNNNNHRDPVITQVMLRPTTESLLCDFDMIVEKACQDRGGWSAVLRQSLSSGDVSHLLDDGSDSDFEYEVDIEASQKSTCNYLTYDQRLELEKKFVNETGEPLCLDPSPQVGLISNRVQFEKFKWNTEELQQSTRKWEENPFKNHKILMKTPDTSLNAPSLAEGRLDIEPFYNFVMGVRARKELSQRTFGLEKDKEALKLPPIPYQDYPNIDPPKNLEEILRIGQIPEPAQIRIFPNENFVRKVEEYTLETERRKRPHTTTLSIFQRNGMESYFGELEMESFLDPSQPRIGNIPSSTKCQFELGSSRNVTLYVKQFSDIFTEDGRRPCKITYQKVGQPPQVVYTNSYKSAAPTPPTPTNSGNPPAAPPPQPQQQQPQIIHVPQSHTVTAVTASVPQQIITSIAIPTSVNNSPVLVQSPAQSVALVNTVTSSPQIAQAQSLGQQQQAVTLPTVVSVQQQQQPQQVQLQQRPQTPAAAAAAVTTTNIVVGSAQGQTPAATSAPSLPPVQIVHPQPRSNPQQLQTQQPQHPQKSEQTAVVSGQQRQIQIFSQQQQQQQQLQTQQQSQTQNVTVAQSSAQAQAANVNLNVNLSSLGVTGLTPQQVLTRPHIINLQQQHQQQQQQQQAAQQQLLQLTQQRILRMKQQQPNNTALAKLLLTNLQSKPITVAVQPTPQNPASATINSNVTSPACSNSSGNPSPAAAGSCSTNANSGNAGNNSANSAPTPSPVAVGDPPTPQQQQQNPLGSPLMIQSPPSVSSAITNPSPNVNVNVNASPNVNVNLNTISLDGLLAASSANINYANTATLTQAGSNLLAASNVNLGLSRITTSSGQPTVNILRLNNNTGTTMTSAAGGGNTVQLTGLQRQLAVSNALNGNVSILQQPGTGQQPQQRILINANSVNNLNLGSSGEIDELSVPDLTTLLGGQPIQISQLGQQQHILTNATATAPSQTTIDTTNLNLNLNVNLNSGTVVNNGDVQVQQHQIAKIQGGEWTTTAQAPPFLVFISPLRPMSIATQAQANAAARQVTPTSITQGQINSPSTLSLNLGAVQQQQHTTQIVQSQPGKVQEGPTRILLGACNNGVAIKREIASSSANIINNNSIPSSSSSSAPSPMITSIPETVTAGSAGSGGGHQDGLDQNPMMDTSSVVDSHLMDTQHLVGNNDVVVDGVDSLFNALSEAIGPEQLQKLDAMGGSLAAAAAAAAAQSSSVPSSVSAASLISSSIASGTPLPMETVSSGMRLISSGSTLVHPSIVPSSSSSLAAQLSNNSSSSGTVTKNNSTNVITLSDLLGSPTVVSSSTGSNVSSFPSLILSSVNNSNNSSTVGSVANSSPTLSSLLNSVTPSSSSSGQGSIMAVTQSSLVSSTPRLSALLAGTPSADTVVVGGANGPTSLLSTTGTPDSSTGTGPVTSASYGTLLDRLAASLNQPQGQANQVRSGASRLNPIATATPSVVLEHPVLAATLTQQQQQQQQQPQQQQQATQQQQNASSVNLNRGPATFRQIAPAPSVSQAGASSVIGNNGNVAVITSSDQSHAIQSPQLINLLGFNTGAARAGQARTIRISANSPANNPSPGSASR